MFLQTERDVSDAFRAWGTPAAVLLRNGAVASAVAGGAAEIRHLAREAASPLPVSLGQALPALQLHDLEGRTLRVNEVLPGRSTLLLLWNPECGFCQGMLKELTAWESTQPANTPELLVVSTGSSELNRRQGLRSRVLLDSDFAVGRTVGSTGHRLRCCSTLMAGWLLKSRSAVLPCSSWPAP